MGTPNLGVYFFAALRAAIFLKEKHVFLTKNHLKIIKNAQKIVIFDLKIVIFDLKIDKNSHFRGRAKRGRDGMGFLRSKIVISIEKVT